MARMFTARAGRALAIALLGVGTSVALPACYATPQPDCSFSCGPDGVCPSGYDCVQSDQLCHLILENGNLAECSVLPDAALIDAGPIDAAPIDGAHADAAPIDAAKIDGTTDDAAKVDARPPDARPPDARPPDARPPDARPPDARPIDARPPIDAFVPPDAFVCPAEDPASDGSGKQALILSQVFPSAVSGMGFIELYNNTNAAIDLSATNFALKSNGSFVFLDNGVVVVPAFSYRTIAWPSFGQSTDSGGELALFQNATMIPDLSDGTKLIDYVCWGTPASGNNTAFAITAGKWSGACAGVLTHHDIRRLPNTEGLSAADYDPTFVPFNRNCTP